MSLLLAPGASSSVAVQPCVSAGHTQTNPPLPECEFLKGKDYRKLILDTLQFPEYTKCSINICRSAE